MNGLTNAYVQAVIDTTTPHRKPGLRLTLALYHRRHREWLDLVLLFAASTLITLVLVVLWQHGQARVDSLNPNSQVTSTTVEVGLIPPATTWR
jgi:hypothetical protein